MSRLHRGEGKRISFGPIGLIEKAFETHARMKEQSCWSDCLRAFLPIAVGLSAVLCMSGCAITGAKASQSQTPIISVAITLAPPASLTVGTFAPVTATVSNDAANAGVDWVAICGSVPNCGSFSPSHTASGATTIFIAPLAVPAHNTIAVTALSTTDHSKAFGASVTIISTVTGVTITQPPPVSAPSGAAITMSATVAGDPSNEGVDWTATCDTVNCTPIGWHSAVGGTVTFDVPTPDQVPTIVGSTVTITAFATADHNFSATASFTVTIPITIDLTQAPPSTMLINATATVIAVVANDTTNSGVSWSVTCSTAPCGSVSPAQTATGAPAIFTAPPRVPAPNPTPNPVVLITARPTAGGPNATATASVTIVTPIVIAITQGVANNSMVKNASAALAAAVNNDAASAGVDWTVTCGSPGACGTFSPTHTASGATTTFTAPNAVPVGITVTITAASTTDPSKNATEIVTITASALSDSLLRGQFVILLAAKNSSNGPYALGGVITGDGTGNITKGNVDVADASGIASPAAPIISQSSSYSIGPDGRGQIYLTINPNVLGARFGVNGTGGITLSVAFVTPQHALLSETDTFGSGTGTLDLQNATDLAAFQNRTAGLNGIYSLQLSGVETAAPNPNYFVAAAVTIQSAAGSSSESAYIADQSDKGVITSVPFSPASNAISTIVPDLNGELTFSSVNLGLPTQFNLDAWLIDANHFAITDWRDSASGAPPVIVAGYLTAQPSSPAISGTYAFTEAGATTAPQPQAAGGIFTCGSTGTLDVTPLGGMPASQAITAVCTAPTSGRGLIAFSGTGSSGINHFAAYPTLDQGLDLIELDGGSAGTSGPSGAGVAMQQTLAAPISPASFSGKYASNFSASTTLGLEGFAAQIVSDGVSKLSGATDVNSLNTTVATPVGTPSVGAALTGSFTAGTDGRFPLVLMITPAAGQPAPAFTTINPACYVVDASTCLLLGLDATAPGTGILRLQNTGL
jgi:hypothetical protein